MWHRFLTELGAEVVLSPKTDCAILAAGAALAPSEICLPVKACLGHYLWLRDKCDLLMIPRLVCRRQNGNLRFGCPKALCLPDFVKALVPGLPPIAELCVDEQKQTELSSFTDFAQELGGNHRSVRAYYAAMRAQTQAVNLLRSSGEIDESWFQDETASKIRLQNDSACDNLRIGVIGHPYLLFDQGLSLNLPALLRSLGVTAEYPTQTPVGTVFPEPVKARAICWYYEQELLAAAWHLLGEKGRCRDVADSKSQAEVDGLLLVSSFSCGTSAVTNEVINREFVHRGVPMLTILLDEHSAETGLVTRLEAFVDLMRHRIRR